MVERPAIAASSQPLSNAKQLSQAAAAGPQSTCLSQPTCDSIKVWIWDLNQKHETSSGVLQAALLWSLGMC